jgi:hypothetical protein
MRMRVTEGKLCEDESNREKKKWDENYRSETK